MKLLPRLILACAAAATCAGAGAQTYDAASDQERRARNREEALAKYHAMQDRPSQTTTRIGERDRDRTAGGPTAGDRARKTSRSVRDFTHRQAEKARRFSDRQEQRFGKSSKPNPNKSRGTPD